MCDGEEEVLSMIANGGRREPTRKAEGGARARAPDAMPQAPTADAMPRAGEAAVESLLLSPRAKREAEKASTQRQAEKASVQRLCPARVSTSAGANGSANPREHARPRAAHDLNLGGGGAPQVAPAKAGGGHGSASAPIGGHDRIKPPAGSAESANAAAEAAALREHLQSTTAAHAAAVRTHDEEVEALRRAAAEAAAEHAAAMARAEAKLDEQTAAMSDQIGRHVERQTATLYEELERARSDSEALKHASTKQIDEVRRHAAASAERAADDHASQVMALEEQVRPPPRSPMRLTPSHDFSRLLTPALSHPLTPSHTLSHPLTPSHAFSHPLTPFHTLDHTAGGHSERAAEPSGEFARVTRGRGSPRGCPARRG